MTTHASITSERIIDAIEEDDSLGFCSACGEEAFGVEPDAYGYTCEDCGARAVYGADVFLINLT